MSNPSDVYDDIHAMLDDKIREIEISLGNGNGLAGKGDRLVGGIDGLKQAKIIVDHIKARHERKHEI